MLNQTIINKIMSEQEKEVFIGPINVDMSKCTIPKQALKDWETFDEMYKNASKEQRAIIDSWNSMGR